MFYAHIILAKKGPLARVWLAAHWDKKITKAHVFETNIEKSVEGIMQPKVKLALRTSGHLLLGVVRIYSRKAKYLLADCNEAFAKIKMAFRPGMVDLPEGHREANVNAITLPEVFHDFDTALPELNDIDLEAQFSVNQSRADEITMREDYGSLSLSVHDDGFGDMGFEGDTPDLMRESLDTSLNNQLFEDEVLADANISSNFQSRLDADVSQNRLDGNTFGDDFGQPSLFEDDLFGEPPLQSAPHKSPPVPVTSEDFGDYEGDDHFDNNVPSPASSNHEFPATTTVQATKSQDDETERKEESHLEQRTSLQNEEESFALAPIDASAYKGITKTKRKRKLIVDEVKNISGEEMKAQLANTSDIVTTLDLAPPTKRLMYWKETGGVEKLFSLPSRNIPASVLFLNYSRHLISRFTQLEDFSCFGPSDLLALDHIQNEEYPIIIQAKRGRKRKNEILPLVQPQQDMSLSDVTSQSLAAPEAVRELEKSASHVSMDAGILRTDSLTAPSERSAIFESMRSPGLMFGMGDMNHMEDDFHHGDMTPAGLHHGSLSPMPHAIDSMPDLPNLPTDQISSILNENDQLEQLDQLVDFQFPGISDEQMENETIEQFEERVLNKRAAQLFFTVKSRIIKQDCLVFSSLAIGNTRKQAAQKFYSLLVLKKLRALNITQSKPYSEITITRGPLFENPKL